MKRILNNFVSWFNPNRALVLIALAITFKFLQAFVFAVWAHEIAPEKMVNALILKNVDYNYFLAPVDNYFDTGEYFHKEGQCYAGRMPGYWFVYMLLRFIMSSGAALISLVILQILLSGLSVFYLAKMCSAVFKGKHVFALTYLLFLLSSFTSVFDFQTLSESLSVPALIFSIYHLVNYTQEENQRRSLLFSGFFLTWAIFLRPYLGVFLLIFGLVILYNERKNLKLLLIHSLLFATPFIVIESAWVLRNYSACNQLILLQQKPSEAYGKNYSDGWIATRTLIHAWGEGGEYFEPQSTAEWFKLKDVQLEGQLKEKYFKGVSYTKEDIIELKNKYHTFYKEEGYNKEKDREIVTLAQQYLDDFREAQPFQYYIGQRIDAFKRLIFHSGSSYVPLPRFSKMNTLQKVVKLCYSGLYYLILVLGFLGLFFAKTSHKTIKVAFVAMLISLILTLIFMSTIQEARYFIAGYALLVPFAGGFLSRMLNWKKN